MKVETGTPAEPEGFKLTPAVDLMQNPKPLPWLIKQILPANSIGQIFGDPASCKSLLALWMAACVATGKPWDECEIKQQGNVIYLAGEGHHGLSARMMALSLHHDIDPIAMHFSELPAALNIATEAMDVANAIDALGLDHVALIVIDTLHRHMSGDENSSQDFGDLLRILDRFRVEYGCTILVIHHSGHGDKSRGRGTSSNRAAWDFEYSMTKQDQLIAMECTKAKDFQDPEPRNFKIRPVNLPWRDEDGFGITSVTLEATDEKPARKTKQMGGQKRIAFNALVEVAKREGVSATDEIRAKNDLPVLCRMVHEDVWREQCYQRGFSGNPAAKRQAFKRAKDDLLNMEKVATWDGFYWAKA